MMAVTKGEEQKKKIFLKSLYLLIAKMFGQTNITPMALAKIVIVRKKESILYDESVQLILEESDCNNKSVTEYFKEKYFESCFKSGSISPCCGYFGKLASEKSILNLTLLTLKYAVPNFIYTHQPLADYLGLPYDHLAFSERIGMTHMVLMCELPHGKLAPCTIPPEGFDILWTPNGYCVTFNEMAPEKVYKVRTNISEIILSTVEGFLLSL